MPISDLFANENKPNILIIITDQERSFSEWPASYRTALSKRLKAMRKLKANGLSFDNAYTAACMCSPARATFLTSQYPVVTGCMTTGKSELPLPTSFPNIATVLTQAGYTCYWIGKWHLFADESEERDSSALSQWGFQPYEDSSGASIAWDPPDAGITRNTQYLGGGTQGPESTNRNDQRYVRDAKGFLADPPSTPWCLVVALINPHDVHLGYQADDGAYYDSAKYQDLNVPLPKTVNESLNDMPRAQSSYTWAKNKHPNAAQQDFANFYAYLVQHVDRQIDSILTSMSETQIRETLIIRFADHGEMGLSHGMVEKFVNAYSQCLHVPLVFSNPVAYPSAQTTEALASTVDLAPTLASLLDVSSSFSGFVGTDLSPVLDDPSRSVQDYVHFTYDDLHDLQNKGPSVIRAIRSEKWLYSVYLHSVDSKTSGYTDADWEMYDLTADPEETKNLAGQGKTEQALLDRELRAQMAAKRTAPKWRADHWPPEKSPNSRGGPPPSSEDAESHRTKQVLGVSAAKVEDLP